MPDLAQLAGERRAIFLRICGNNFKEWAARIASLHKREFHLLDREQEPETTARQKVVDSINQRSGCQAVLTRKLTIENYLHPLAISEACGIELCFDDDSDVASLLALKMMVRSGDSSWHQVASKRQRRLHEKAKKILNVKAVQHMTPALLAQQDPDSEIVSWLQAIARLVGATS